MILICPIQLHQCRDLYCSLWGHMKWFQHALVCMFNLLCIQNTHCDNICFTSSTLMNRSHAYQQYMVVTHPPKGPITSHLDGEHVLLALFPVSHLHSSRCGNNMFPHRLRWTCKIVGGALTKHNYNLSMLVCDVALVDDEILYWSSVFYLHVLSVPNMVPQSTWPTSGRHTPSTPGWCACGMASGSCDLTITGSPKPYKSYLSTTLHFLLLWGPLSIGD